MNGKLAMILIFLLTVFLYGFFLDRTPVHFNQDELGFSLNAYGIAKNGTDESGKFLPIYFWHLGVMWATPITVYVTALILKFVPLSEVTVRATSVLFGALDVVLIYFLAKKLFRNWKYAFLAAGLLATTPIHFIQSRILLDNLYVVPFVIGWLLALLTFTQTKKPIYLLFAGLLLGFGFYSYHAARIMMPFYVLVTAFYVWPDIRKNKKLALVFLTGFIAPLVPLIPWTRKYPETLFLDQVKYVGIYDPNKTPFSGFMTILSQESLIHRADVFVSYFKPIYMFLLGDASLIHSTSLHHPLGLLHSAVRAGIFLLPLAIFIPLGIYWSLKDKSRFNKLIVFGFLTAPIAGALAGDHYRYSRILFILPFAIILATYGVQFLFSRRKKILRVACYVLLVTCVLQFSYFYYDYFTGYRIRSYSWMKYDIPGAMEAVINQDKQKPSTAIYIDNRIEFVDRYWKFYLLKHNALGLKDKTEYFDPKMLRTEELSKNSITLFNFNDISGQKEELGDFKKIQTIREPDFVPSFYLYRN